MNNEKKQKEIMNGATETIEKYCSLYNDIKKHGFTEPVSISIFQEVGKALRSIEFTTKKAEDKLKPSDKQISYAKRLGILNPEKYNRIDLSNEIDKELNK